jgi:hypothetical protein
MDLARRSRLTVSPWTGQSWLYSLPVHADHILGWRSQNRTDRVFNSVCLVTEWTLLFALGECRILPWPWDRVHSVPQIVDLDSSLALVQSRLCPLPWAESTESTMSLALGRVDRVESILGRGQSQQVVMLGTESNLSLALGRRQSGRCPKALALGQSRLYSWLCCWLWT